MTERLAVRGEIHCPRCARIRFIIERCECGVTDGMIASGMSAFGQDPQGLEAKPASPTGEAGDAQQVRS